MKARRVQSDPKPDNRTDEEKKKDAEKARELLAQFFGFAGFVAAQAPNGQPYINPEK